MQTYQAYQTYLDPFGPICQDPPGHFPWDKTQFHLKPIREQNVEVFQYLRDVAIDNIRTKLSCIRNQNKEINKRLEELDDVNQDQIDLYVPSLVVSEPATTLDTCTTPNTPTATTTFSPTATSMFTPTTPTPTTIFSPGQETLQGDLQPSAFDILENQKENNPIVTINVGGVKHEVMWKVLESKPRTRLGKLARSARTSQHEAILELVDAYSPEDNEFFIDRDPATFNCVLNYYRTGRLHLIDELCTLDFEDDLKYWMIDTLNLEICCIDKFNTRKEHILSEVAKEEAIQNGEVVEEEDFGEGYFVPFQKALNDLFEKPQSSLAAKIVSLFSIGLVLISTVGFCFNTFPWMQVRDKSDVPQDNPKLALVEAFCISYFTIEFLLRLAGSPDKLVFMKGTMNVIDCLAIAPYYLTLFFMPPPDLSPPTGDEPLEEPEEEGGFGNVGRIMQVFRIARIMRIFKLARRSVGLQSIAHTVKTSWKDLGLLFSLVLMGMLVFGSLEYYIEGAEEDTGFYSIPQGMWWALQTLTSVGYGDFTATTVLGKGIGGMCGVCGVLVMALPIPIVVDNFADYYEEQKKIEAKELKKEAQEEVEEWEKKKNEVAMEGLLETLRNNTFFMTENATNAPAAAAAGQVWGNGIEKQKNNSNNGNSKNEAML